MGTDEYDMPVSVTPLEDDQNVSMAVVDAVAEAKNVSPTEIQPPLYRVIDTDALNQLFRPDADARASDPRASFRYAGYEITVCGRGEVAIQPEADDERGDAE